MLGSSAYELEPLEDIDEQDLFLSILYHDARGGNAIRMLLGEEESSKPYINHFANKSWKKIGYRSSKYNAYASVNTFRSYKRVSDEVYNLSGIFIDLDGHDYKSVEEMDRAIEKTKKRLQRAYKNKEITAPTMITHTGRGLGLFYILSSSIANSPKAQKSVRYLDQVRAALTAKYKTILDGNGYLEVDSTVKDYARVCRMPLTMNQKCNRWCRLVHVSYTDEGEVAYCDLKQLAQENHLFDKINEVRKQLTSRKVISLDAYRMPFLTIRLQKLELLQELRHYVCTGSREYMIFIYYNAAKQIYGETEANAAVRAFNDKFVEPLSEQELEHAFSVTDKNKAPTGDYEGFYKLPDSWITEVLEVTDIENAKCRFGASKRQIERQNIKEENHNRREERNKIIAEYIIDNPGQTYPEIAAQFGVSESMIYRICKQYDLRRNKTKQAEQSDIPEQVVETAQNKTLQNLSQSLLGVPFFPVSVVTPLGISLDPVAKEDGLIQAYADLYGEVTKKRRRSKQMKGQMGFRIASDGSFEYYLIS